MGADKENRKQQHRNAEQWHELITAWRASGKTRKTWCQEQGLAYESLRRWTKRLRNSSDKLHFVEIGKGPEIRSPSDPTRIRVGEDGVIELYGNVSEELLRKVLRVMRETADVH
jgi:hypothetical protein